MLSLKGMSLLEDDVFVDNVKDRREACENSIVVVGGGRDVLVKITVNFYLGENHRGEMRIGQTGSKRPLRVYCQELYKPIYEKDRVERGSFF